MDFYESYSKEEKAKTRALLKKRQSEKTGIRREREKNECGRAYSDKVCTTMRARERVSNK
jgi:hypothetical protein